MPNIQSDFHLEVNGKILPDIAKKYFNDIEINESFNDTTELVISLNLSESFPLSIHDFVNGKPIVCKFKADKNFITSFDGEIFKKTRTFSKEDGVKLELICYDRSFRLKYSQDEKSIITNKEVSQLHDLTKSTFLNKEIKKAGYNQVVIEPYKKLLQFTDSQSIIIGDDKIKTIWMGLAKLAWLNGLRLISRGKILFMVDDKYISQFMSAPYSLVWDPTEEQKQSSQYLPISKIGIEENMMSKDRDVAAIFWTHENKKKSKDTKTEVKDTEVTVNKNLIDLSNLDLSSQGYDTTDRTQINTNIVDVVTVNYNKTDLFLDQLDKSIENIDNKLKKDFDGFMIPFYKEKDDSEEIQLSEENNIVFEEHMKILSLADSSKDEVFRTGVLFPRYYVEENIRISKKNIVHENIKTKEQAIRVVEKEIENNKVLMIVGDVDIQGTPYIRMGQWIPVITNVNGNWNRDMEGSYFIEKTQLKYNSSDGFSMNLGIVRPYFFKLLEANKGILN